MEHQANYHFNEKLRERTMELAVQVHAIFTGKRINQITRPMIHQLIRSSSSVAANFRAATRARSDAEFYAKICIVVEECDETQFWFDYLLRIEILNYSETDRIRSETAELVKIFTTIKKKMRERLNVK